MESYQTFKFLAFLLLFSTSSCEQSKENLKPDRKAPSQEEIDRQKSMELTLLMKQENVPRVSITHVKNGKSISYYLGVKKYQAKDSVTATTLFQAASMTKAAAAYTAMRLLDKVVFELDKPLSEYWENPRLKNVPYANEVTARMTLNCTSGLPDWLRERPLKINFKPGTEYLYSGEGFQYLQEVLVHLTGKPYAQIVGKEVLIPFGMLESSMLYHESKQHLYAYGHHGESGLVPSEMRKFEIANAAYTLWTTSTDYMKLLKKRIVSGVGLKPETHRMMFTSGSSVNPDYAFAIRGYKTLSYRNQPGTV